MIFSLFETRKDYNYKVQLKNYNKVVIGSGTDLERAFQIGNFMNMLYSNIENKQKSMSPKVVKHNLINELESLIRYHIKDIDDYCEEDWYDEQKEEIINGIEMLFDILKSRKEFEVEYQKEKDKGIKKLVEIEDHISFLTNSLYNIYDGIVINIVFTFPEYFEYIE